MSYVEYHDILPVHNALHYVRLKHLQLGVSVHGIQYNVGLFDRKYLLPYITNWNWVKFGNKKDDWLWSVYVHVGKSSEQDDKQHSEQKRRTEVAQHSKLYTHTHTYPHTHRQTDRRTDRLDYNSNTQAAHSASTKFIGYKWLVFADTNKSRWTH